VSNLRQMKTTQYLLSMLFSLICPQHQSCSTSDSSLATVLGRPFVKTVRPMLSFCCPVCLSCLSVCLCLSVCNVGVLWPNGWADQDETWHAGRPRLWPHCVRWGPSSHSPKEARPPNFRPISVAAKWLHGSRCHLVGR